MGNQGLDTSRVRHLVTRDVWAFVDFHRHRRQREGDDGGAAVLVETRIIRHPHLCCDPACNFIDRPKVQ